MTIQKAGVTPFTPGPWRYYEDAIGNIYGNPPKRHPEHGVYQADGIAHSPLARTKRIEDARLIAAAPSLYAALVACIEQLEDAGVRTPIMRPVLKRAREAIRLVGEV